MKTCKRCGGSNISFQMVQTGGKSGHQGNGIGGHSNNFARGITAMSSLGLSNLVWRKSKGSSKHKFKNESIGLCQDCGTTVKV